MRGVLRVVVEDAVDPDALRPTPASAAVFVLLAAAVVLLLLSMVRHIRRAQRNLGSARDPVSPEGPSDAGEGEQR